MYVHVGARPDTPVHRAPEPLSGALKISLDAPKLVSLRARAETLSDPGGGQ